MVEYWWKAFLLFCLGDGPSCVAVVLSGYLGRCVMPISPWPKIPKIGVLGKIFLKAFDSTFS